MTTRVAAECTPGPWAYQEGADAYTHIVRATGNLFLCQLPQDTTGRAEANARLIAAAPTMYHELELAADTFRDLSNVLRAIGKDVMAAAANIAERHIREQLAAIGSKGN